MSYCERNDIPYALHGAGQDDDPLRKFDFYFYPDTHGRPLICFIHGGAWRAEDKHLHASLARKILTATGCPVAVPNYRLTPPNNDDPRYRHPMHAKDVLTFLNFIIDWEDDSCAAAYDASKLVLIGHSCSAHMLLSILLDSQQPSLEPSRRLLSSVVAVIMSEGIYDLDALLAHFPDYREWFIAPAFGTSDSYHNYSAVHFPSRTPIPSIRWLLLHSKGDGLVDSAQTIAMHTHLSKLVEPSHVVINTEDLVEDHDDTLKSAVYIEIVKKFVAEL